MFGIVTGGNLSTYFGGIKSKKALYYSLFVAALCLVVAAPVPFIDSFATAIVLMWFLLFFGGSILPFLTALMLATVPKNQVPIANALANLQYNLMGFLPAPVVYGLIYDSGQGKNDRLAMGCLMYVTVITLITHAISTFYLIKDNVLGYEEENRP